jgi:hypothetical protein
MNKQRSWMWLSRRNLAQRVVFPYVGFPEHEETGASSGKLLVTKVAGYASATNPSV